MKLIVILLCFLSIGCNDSREVVLRVKDSDTFVLASGEVIRLCNVDGIERTQFMGEDARRFADSILTGNEVYIKREGRDRYKRTLADIEIDGQSFSQLLIANGYAVIYYRYCKDKSLIAEYENSKKLKRGMFAYHWISPASYRKQH
jgi:micrococcal nuclease